ncbi:hypothetical protein ACN6KF_005521 [Labrys sp. La1]|uniref:hypothetical protein n=1 Tax=Labrys sp. La1 TaxID=3404917 RepID=UPI003EB838B6
MIRAPYSLGGGQAEQGVPAPSSAARAMHVHFYALFESGTQARMAMAKKPFTTRIDPEILVLAQKIAEAERRSVTAVIELALLEYAAKRGINRAESKDTSGG